MLKRLFIFFEIIFFLITIPGYAQEQQPPNPPDTFFLVKKKGLLGQLGKSISTSDDEQEPVKKVNPYLQYTGRVIRHIHILRLGFERDINDTLKYNISFGTVVANAFHKKTRERVVKNNLFFREGDIIQPYLLADNERHLREQPFVQDALIKVQITENAPDSADIVVLLKDVFSIGGSADISSPKDFRLEVKDENIGGAGTRLAFSTLYDNERRPRWGTGVDLIKRNIRGTFINWNIGFKTFNNAFSSGKKEEAAFYTSFEKPLVSPYLRTVGGAELSFNQTSNNYAVSDSFYIHDIQYRYNKADGWFGYNFDANTIRMNNAASRIKKLVALRAFNLNYRHLPIKVQDSFDYRYSDTRALLASFIIFKQNFYRTNFIYGFGRNEDVPEGFNISAVAGWVNKKDSIVNTERSRPYYAIDASMSRFNSKGFYSNYIFRLGGFMYKGKWEDVDLLMNVEHFTRKRILSSNWYFRQFINLGFTKQLSRVLNQPLYLRSIFGLPYFSNGDIKAKFRATFKTESVFYGLRKFWGFRFAPFAFGDVSLIQRDDKSFRDSEWYSAVGAGVRTRNENLIFGTIELKGFYFPRTVQGMGSFKVELSSNIRFKYNSTFIRKPDFILAN
jgi:hypothetical protein